MGVMAGNGKRVRGVYSESSSEWKCEDRTVRTSGSEKMKENVRYRMSGLYREVRKAYECIGWEWKES